MKHNNNKEEEEKKKKELFFIKWRGKILAVFISTLLAYTIINFSKDIIGSFQFDIGDLSKNIYIFNQYISVHLGKVLNTMIYTSLSLFITYIVYKWLEHHPVYIPSDHSRF